MRLPLRRNPWNGIHFCTALLCAAVIVLAAPRALAWHDDDDWRPRHHRRHFCHDHGDGRVYFVAPPFPPFFVPLPRFGVRGYPSYSAPYPHWPCR
ncbi:MAG TPA: hypothetical protein VKM54_17485 [Myxococcota bacterium]|nr:hypothetical protein [Myxococcota bacterium]